MDRRRQNRILLMMALLMAIPMGMTGHLTLQDIPDWILQAKILNNLDDPGYAPFYSLKILPVPNCLGTLIIAGAGRFIGEIAAAKVLALVCIVLFVFGFTYLRRADGRLTPHIEILGALYAVNHFFMMGYLNFCLGLGLAFIAIGYYWRRAPVFAIESSAVLGFLLLLVYLSHFLAFFIATFAVLFIAFRTWFGQWRNYIPPVAAVIPSTVLLIWYAAARSGSFAAGYELSPLKFVWYKLAPFAPLSNFHPVSPAGVAWGVAFINALVIFAVITLVAWLFVSKRVDIKSPLVMCALALTGLGLVAPTQIFELVRPGQRLIFGAFFLFMAGIAPPRTLRKEVRTLPVMILATVLALNGMNIFYAGKHVDLAAEAIAKHIPENATLLMINDSHFEDHAEEGIDEKLVSPFSYPVWVNPLKQVGYYHVYEKGGIIGHLFPSGFIKVTNDKPPAVNSFARLADRKIMKNYTHVVVTGTREIVEDMTGRLSGMFDVECYYPHFAIMKWSPNKMKAHQYDSFLPGFQTLFFW